MTIKLTNHKDYLSQLIYNDKGVLQSEKIDYYSTLKGINFSYSSEVIILNMQESAGADYQRQLAYADITDYSTDGSTWVVRPAFAALVSAIKTNVNAQQAHP